MDNTNEHIADYVRVEFNIDKIIDEIMYDHDRDEEGTEKTCKEVTEFLKTLNYTMEGHRTVLEGILKDHSRYFDMDNTISRCVNGGLAKYVEPKLIHSKRLGIPLKECYFCGNSPAFSENSKDYGLNESIALGVCNNCWRHESELKRISKKIRKKEMGIKRLKLTRDKFIKRINSQK